MTESKKEDILRKVRALLAKAASTNFEHEADAFRSKADELMALYAIEAWQLKDAKTGERRKPEKRMVDIAWYWTAEGAVNDQLWFLLNACATHSRCLLVPEYVTSRQVPMVGMEADLDYCDMIFTDLFIQLIAKIDPKPDPSLDYFDNLAMLKEAGMGWDEIGKRMVSAELGPKGLTGNAARDRMIRDYRSWCKRTGTPQNYSNWKTYRRNFASGFVNSIRNRMYAMRKDSQQEGTGSSTDLVLRDIRQVVKESLDGFFPGLNAARAKEVVKYSTDNRKTDYAAKSAGMVAGDNARIAANASQLGNQPKKQIQN